MLFSVYYRSNVKCWFVLSCVTLMDIRLVATDKGKLVSLSWIESFIGLSKSEQRILLGLLAERVDSSKTSLTNLEIAKLLDLHINQVNVYTKSLTDKEFLASKDVQLQPKTKPSKHYWVPTTVVRHVTDPAYAKWTSGKIGHAGNMAPQMEPTNDRSTWKQVDPDMAVGYS